MARYKKQISIYVKESWISEIQFFAEKAEEDVSSYIQRAIQFQLLHDRKLYEKKKAQDKDITAQIKALDPGTTPQEKIDEMTKALVDLVSTKKNIEIAKTRYIDNN